MFEIMTITIDRKKIHTEISNALGFGDYPNEIMHYTSTKGLEGILGSGELWLVNLKEMNDTSEVSHFIESICSEWPDNLFGANRSEVVGIIRALAPIYRNKTYISSWCAFQDSDGRINMWREYADNGAGVAIVVDYSPLHPSNLSDKGLQFPVMMTKIEYVQKQGCIDHARSYFEKLKKNRTCI